MGWLFPDRPKELTLDKIDFDKLGSDQASDIGKNLSGALELGGKASQFNLDQLFQALERWSPGMTEAAKQAFADNAKNELAAISGELGADEKVQLQRENAYASLRGGFGGSEAASNRGTVTEATARLNKLMSAMGSGARWTQLAQSQTSPVNFNVNSMFVPLEQRMNYLADYYSNKAQVDQYNNEIMAAASPMGQAILNASLMALGQGMGDLASLGGSGGGPITKTATQDPFAGWDTTQFGGSLYAGTQGAAQNPWSNAFSGGGWGAIANTMDAYNAGMQYIDYVRANSGG